MIVSILAACTSLVAFAPVAAAQDPLVQLQRRLPTSVIDCSDARSSALAVAANELERWGADQQWNRRQPNADDVLRAVRRVVAAKAQVDRALHAVLALRVQFASMPADAVRRQRMRNYLTQTSQLIDLTGRLRYLLRDLLDNAAYDLDPEPEKFAALLDLLIEQRVSIGAGVMAYALFDPPAGSGAVPYPDETKRQVLQLMAAARHTDLLPDLAEFVQGKNVAPELLILASETIRELGLPQDPRPGQDPTLPPPAITAGQLRAVLEQLDLGAAPELRPRRAALLAWLAQRMTAGIASDEFRLGNFEVRDGDWLLMRNPSPYNRFTDLSPGLFTHVGVVSVETGGDGIRRFVIVDLPERGDRIPATNVDTYLRRTLHYFFLRHRDPAIGQRMGEIAAQLVGNETQFDLTFRTQRVLDLKGMPLRGQRINTYCAGLLLLCAQETTAPREEFFPIEESPAGGYCSENLAKLGLAIGDHFVSPTGAIFSSQMQIAGSREPMYDPGREVKEYVFDHFADSMISRQLTPSPDTKQMLLQRIAGLSKYNPWLARALARANNVSQHIDLESAAKAAAVIQTLDEIADSCEQQFNDARQALLAGPAEQLAANGFDRREIARIQQLRNEHRDLFAAWSADRVTPRRLRIALVEYYCAAGRKRLDERFFRAE